MTRQPGTPATFGAPANNIIHGSEGDDTLRGGMGSDTMTGGAGRDVFDFSRKEERGNPSSGFHSACNSDVIANFTSGDDIIDLAGICR
jgi:Ca2+-binding RTX toxin-like protein